MRRSCLPSFPLLGKELIELAARKRTYALRFIYAALFFAIYLLTLVSMQRAAGDNVFRLVGRGHELFTLIVTVQMWAVYIVLPAAIAPAITYEKERNALELLLLTGISPWQILLQKLVARLIPILTLMLLSLPVMAVSYAYGGFGSAQLAAAAYVMLLGCLQVAAVGLMWSCFCRTTAEAFIFTYATLGVLYAGPALLFFLSDEFFRWSYVPGVEDFLFVFAPPYLMIQALWGGFAGSSVGMAGAVGIGIWLTIVAAMVLARVWLVTRMHVTPRRYGMRLLKWLDEFFRGLNRFAGNRVIVADRSQLPGDQPVAWRETRSRWIGRPNHLLRVLLLVEIPILLICFFHVTASSRDPELFPALVFTLWFGSALLLIVQTVNVIGSERTHQTLDVLLTTPLTGRDILRQKLAPIRRLLTTLLVPLVTVIAFEWWWEWEAGGNVPSWMRGSSSALYAMVSAASIAVYLPLCIWGAATIALRLRSHGRALIVSIMTAAGVCVAPLAMGLILMLDPFEIDDDSPLFQLLVSFSPATVIALNEFKEIGSGNDLFTGYVVFAMVVMGAVTLLLRHLCYVNADHLLGRAPGPAPGTLGTPEESRRVPTPVSPVTRAVPRDPRSEPHIEAE